MLHNRFALYALSRVDALFSCNFHCQSVPPAGLRLNSVSRRHRPGAPALCFANAPLGLALNQIRFI